MQQEISALKVNNTLTIAELPLGERKTISSKWVYKIRYKYNGDMDRYKTSLVTKWYSQSEGHNYHDTLSPVNEMITIKIVLCLDASHGWDLSQIDVNNALLQDYLVEDIYMELPLAI